MCACDDLTCWAEIEGYAVSAPRVGSFSQALYDAGANTPTQTATLGSTECP